MILDESLSLNLHIMYTVCHIVIILEVEILERSKRRILGDFR